MMANETIDAHEQQEAFCKFLDSRAMTIDVWNGDNFMHFGQVRVPLYHLMRQSELNSRVFEQFDIIESENATKVGQLQLELLHHARLLKEDEILAAKRVAKSKQAMRLAKVVKSNPFSDKQILEALNDNPQPETIDKNLQLDEEERKKRRIQRIRQQGLAQKFNASVFTDKEATQWEKLEQMKYVEHLRQIKKQALLQRITQTVDVKTAKVVNVVSGEPNVFEYELNNNFDEDQIFKIEIADEDIPSGRISEPELVVVDNSHSEWAHWVSKRKAERPRDFGCVKARNMNVTVSKGDSVKVLFKFQSFRQPVVEEDDRKPDHSSELHAKTIRVDFFLNNSFNETT